MTEISAQSQAPMQTPTATPWQGEPCESCGALLAADQRYCLNCGHRRGGPRVDYRHYMATAAGPAEQAPAPNGAQPTTSSSAPEEPKKERDYAPLAAVGGIAVLGLMLLVGVLIGKGNNNSGSPAPAKVVVPSVSSAEPNTASTPEEASESKASAKKAKGGGGSTGTGAKKANGTLTSGGHGNQTVEASKNELENLGGESGESYEKQAGKLPNKIATPGKPPPIDKTKPPGGGGEEAEVIK